MRWLSLIGRIQVASAIGKVGKRFGCAKAVWRTEEGTALRCGPRTWTENHQPFRLIHSHFIRADRSENGPFLFSAARCQTIFREDGAFKLEFLDRAHTANPNTKGILYFYLSPYN